MARKPRYYVDGKYVANKKDIPKTAKLSMVVFEEYYETPEYTKQQAVNAHNYFARQREINEDMERYHG